MRDGYHTPELDVIFWGRVRKKDLDECWPYIGKSRAAKADTRQTFQGVVASRYAYEAAIGPIPEGARVCHTCPGGNCCNPGHLITSSYPSQY